MGVLPVQVCVRCSALTPATLAAPQVLPNCLFATRVVKVACTLSLYACKCAPAPPPPPQACICSNIMIVLCSAQLCLLSPAPPGCFLACACEVHLNDAAPLSSTPPPMDIPTVVTCFDSPQPHQCCFRQCCTLGAAESLIVDPKPEALSAAEGAGHSSKRQDTCTHSTAQHGQDGTQRMRMSCNHTALAASLKEAAFTERRLLLPRGGDLKGLGNRGQKQAHTEATS